jgi:hypothetical protein
MHVAERKDFTRSQVLAEIKLMTAKILGPDESITRNNSETQLSGLPEARWMIGKIPAFHASLTFE